MENVMGWDLALELEHYKKISLAESLQRAEILKVNNRFLQKILQITERTVAPLLKEVYISPNFSCVQL